MDNKLYEIQGRKLTQGEMTLGQTKRLLKFIAENNNSGLKNIKDVSSAIPWLVENELIEQALDIILSGDKSGIDWDNVSNTMLLRIGKDFLALNSEWITELANSLSK